MITRTTKILLLRKGYRAILFCTFFICSSKFLFSQDIKNNIVGGSFFASYSHTYLDDYWGIANTYYCHLSLIYGRTLRNYYLPSLGEKSFLSNYLASRPFIYGFKADFEPNFSITEKGGQKIYKIQYNPFLRIYSSFNLFLEAGLGIDYVRCKPFDKVPQTTGPQIYFIGPSVRDLGYYLEGGLGYEISLTKNITIDPVIIYRYRKGFKTKDESKNALLETKYGLFPYMTFQCYF